MKLHSVSAAVDAIPRDASTVDNRRTEPLHCVISIAIGLTRNGDGRGEATERSAGPQFGWKRSVGISLSWVLGACRSRSRDCELLCECTRGRTRVTEIEYMRCYKSRELVTTHHGREWFWCSQTYVGRWARSLNDSVVLQKTYTSRVPSLSPPSRLDYVVRSATQTEDEPTCTWQVARRVLLAHPTKRRRAEPQSSKDTYRVRLGPGGNA